VLTVRGADPSKGPQIPGWKQYSPADPGSLAILGLSESAAQAGNHTATDAACAYWNTLLPQYPQVHFLSAFVLRAVLTAAVQTFPACGSWTC
jgi:hypothetical protein